MAKHILTDGSPARDGDAAEAAAYWDARLRSPECTGEDRLAYESWRNADPANASAFEDLQEILDALRASVSRPMMRALRDAALRKRRRRFVVGSLAAVAAMALIMIGISFVPIPGQPGYRATVAQSGASAATDRARVYETAIGERGSFRLEDGSTVTLNTRSRLEARFTEGRRDITLVAGQAFFRVAHDAGRPFVVSAGDRQVTAIGTQFDVRLDRDTVRVVIVEGRIAVERRPKGRLVDAVLNDRRELSAGQSYSTTEGFLRPPAVGQADVNQATLWEEGRVAFNDIPLTDAIAELNRYSARAIMVADPSMRELRISGVFRTDRPQSFINAAEEYLPIEVREQPGGDMLLVWRKSRTGKIEAPRG